MRLLPTCFALLFATPLHAAEWTWTYADNTAPVTHRIADDGTTYLVGNTAANTHVVTRLAPDGTVAWRREHAGVWTRGTTLWPREPDTLYTSPLTTLGIGSDRLCVFGGGENADARVMQTQFAACYRLEDGEALSRFAFDQLRLAGGDESYSLLLPDGGFVNFVAGTTLGGAPGVEVRTGHHRRFAATGALLHDIDTNGFGYVDGRPQDGSVLLQSRAGFRVVDANGTRRFDLDSGPFGATARFAPDGSIHVVGMAPGNLIEWRHVGADGRELSRRSFDPCSGCPAPIGPLAGPLRLSIDRSQVFVTARVYFGEYVWTGFGFQRRERELTTRITAPPFQIEGGGYFRVDPATGGTIAVSGYSSSGIRSLDAATGTELRTRYLTGGDPARARVSDDGTLRLILQQGSQSVVALANAWAARPPTRVGQTGLRGAWYAPYLSGQGFVVEYLPATNTLFIPWFTYEPADAARSARDLRWYTLQGRVAPDATRATLDILLNAGGVFASPPETQPSVVGSATLEAYDCDSATLEYDLGSGPQVLSLTRLTSPTEPCVLADGTTRGSAPPARDGFDARQSGAWFTRGRAGQGLTFVVRPGGLFFGAWFTYDPATSPDDPATQHWFSLQGGLSTARNGSVTLPIYRTTGGLRDVALPTTTVAVGTATITFTACDTARLDYRFPDTPVAGSFRAELGTLALEKIGGCGP